MRKRLSRIIAHNLYARVLRRGAHPSCAAAARILSRAIFGDIAINAQTTGLDVPIAAARVPQRICTPPRDDARDMRAQRKPLRHGDLSYASF